MLTGPILDRLHALNLAGMARALLEQCENPAYAELPFEDRLGLLVDREATGRRPSARTGVWNATCAPPSCGWRPRSRTSTSGRRWGSIARSYSSSRRRAGWQPTSRSS